MSIAVGISVRSPWLQALLRGRKSWVDVLEFMIDDVLDPESSHARTLRRLGRKWPLVAHGVALGIGGADGVDRCYLNAVAEACARIGARWYTEHLSFVRVGGIDLGHFVALDGEDDTLAVLSRNASLVRELVGRPLLLENPADVLGLFSAEPQPGRALGRAYTRGLHAAEAGALLDLTNLLYDARNGGWSPDDFLAELDFDRVVQVHLAGGFERGGLWVDSHSEPVEPDALELLREVARRSPNLRAVIIERDDQLPALDAMLAEVETVRATLARPRTASTSVGGRSR